MNEKYKYTNRLINEKSLYLLQHANQPVDWYPWGQQAFDEAKIQGKPIFLSIGYSTCHWCHMMAKESFSNEEIAKKMNESFINIKVDREELPEVDGIYIEFAQAMMAGAVGWPLNLVLTDDLKPFFAATYLPPFTTETMIGLNDVIDKIQTAWKNEKEKERLIEQANNIVEVFKEQLVQKGKDLPNKEMVNQAVDILYQVMDPVYGGLKGAPKFPIAYQIIFLLNYFLHTKDTRALFIVERTLTRMFRGGIYDHLGGGFSRYSIDEMWEIPHFEKMLYDNAILAESYLQAWKITKRPLYKEVCEGVIGYVLRELEAEKGGFFSAQDADSGGEEGKFYLWSEQEIVLALGKKDATLFNQCYSVTSYGNFNGKNVLHLSNSYEELAKQLGIEKKALKEKLQKLCKKLFNIRKTRKYPCIDDKLLTSWNGLMIHTLAQAGATFDRQEYIEAAEKAAQFIKDFLWIPSDRSGDNYPYGRLLHRFAQGEAKFSATLEDYSFLIRGLLSLFEVGRGLKWLVWAFDLTQVLKAHFKENKGAFYQTDGMDKYLILRKCQFTDGAEPSGNAVHCENLLRLYRTTLNTEYLGQAEDILKASKKFMESYAPGYCYHLINLDAYYDENFFTIIVALNDKRDLEEEIRQLLTHYYLPYKAIIWKDLSEDRLERLLPFTKGYIPVNGQTTLYICKQGLCQEPLTNLDRMEERICSIYSI